MAREMKDSGIEWLGNLPSYWTRNKVIRLFSVIGSGTTPKTTDENAYIGDVHWLQSGDINGTFIYTSKNTISQTTKENHSVLKTYSAPFIIVAMYGASIGNASISLIDACVNQACCVLANPKINLHYAFYSLKAAQSYLTKQAAGGGQPNISQDKIKSLWLPVPPSREQQIIVDYLDHKCAEIDRVLEKTRASIEEYKKLKQSVITQAVTKGIRGEREMKDSGIEWIGEIPKEWEISFLKYSIKWKSVKGYGQETVLSLYRDYGVVIKDSREDNHNVTSLDTDTYKYVEIGDFVINKMKAWQGSMAVSNYNGIISPAYHICQIINPNVFKRYFHHLMRNQLYIPEYTRLSTGMRIGQWDLSFDDFRNLPFIIPPMDEQIEIADYIDRKCSEIDTLISKKELLITELEAYKKSLIYEYVTGKKEVIYG